MASFCSNCGFPLGASNAFCPKCGTRLTAQPVQPAPAPPPQAAMPPQYTPPAYTPGARGSREERFGPKDFAGGVLRIRLSRNRRSRRRHLRRPPREAGGRVEGGELRRGPEVRSRLVQLVIHLLGPVAQGMRVCLEGRSLTDYWRAYRTHHH